MVEENGRNQVNCRCRGGPGCILRRTFLWRVTIEINRVRQSWLCGRVKSCTAGSACSALPRGRADGHSRRPDTRLDPFTQIVVVRLLVVHGFCLAAPFMRRKCRKIILQPVECFRGVLAGPLLCSCSVQKLIPGSLKNGFWC